MAVHLKGWQPACVRAFIYLTIERLTNSAEFVLSAKELIAPEANGRRISSRSAR